MLSLRLLASGARQTRSALPRLAAVPVVSTQNSQRSMSSSASKHWAQERYVSVGLLALIPAAAVVPGNPVIDWSLAVMLPVHAHWGMQEIITDYIPNPTARTMTMGLLWAMTAGTIFGLAKLNLSDDGVSTFAQQLFYPEK